MNVLLFSRYGRLGSSSRLRMYQYLPYIDNAGINVTISALLDDKYLERLYSGKKIRLLKIIKSYFLRFYCLSKIRKYDLVWIEKELFPWLPAFAELLLKYLGIPYIVDYDDATFHRYDIHHNSLIRIILGTKIDAVMRRASLVVVGNDYIAERARTAGARRIEYLPTVIDLDRYPSFRDNDNEIFTIGWVGTQITSKYLNILAPGLADIAAKRHIKLIAVGPTTLKLPDVPVETRSWSEDSEVQEICTFDVGTMPLPDNPWERGKCGYKLIQYMACSVPVIASPIGANRKIVEHGVNGFLASTQQEWIDAIQALMDNKELLQKFGKAGREKVEKEYSLQVWAPRLVGLMRQTAHESV